ncbi:tetratricopeptide repeat protein [Simkania negevensis]|uniref:Tetratricopeptide repeat protein n=1 Tax=Simkania negevensis TaxID=83561 RepID=A0ABS3AR07_9BACT|nr:tetratricopeptide repeat protein [Simkania negevensis]
MPKQTILFCFLSASLLFSRAFSNDVTTTHIETLYHTINPLSIPQHFAFYRLYPKTPLGKKAFEEGWQLLIGEKSDTLADIALPLLSIDSIEAVLALVLKNPNERERFFFPAHERELINTLANRLANRTLRGAEILSEEELLALAPEEVDLARGLMLSQLPDTADRLDYVESYEALIDLMALQILTKTSMDASAEEKIAAINDFLFFAMGFRFPPHSAYANSIDEYTFLQTVLDSREGVCLGVTTLYLSLAQRIALPLEVVTPPGHIFLRHSGKEINIETTARGINLPSDTYLSINTRSLQTRNIKEVIGLTHFNQASVYWQKGEHTKAIASYEKAAQYLPNEMLIKEFLGLHYLFIGKKKLGREYLNRVKDWLPDYAVSKETFAEDYLNNKVDIEGLKTLFLHVDNSRKSIEKKCDALQETVKRHPEFRSGLFHLAATWLQLGRAKEAVAVLERYHKIDPNNPNVEYYLAALHKERYNLPKAWEHLHNSERITAGRDHKPKPLKALHTTLNLQCVW